MDELERVAAAAVDGDPLAAATLVRATQSDVWRLCAALGDRDTADDLTQETYARAFAALHRFEGRSSRSATRGTGPRIGELRGADRRLCPHAVSRIP